MKIKHLLNALAAFGLLSAPAVAQNLSADDLGFAFGAEAKSELNAVEPKPSSVALMTEEDMIATEGEGFYARDIVLGNLWGLQGFIERVRWRAYNTP